jgi:hypothetical protein
MSMRLDLSVGSCNTGPVAILESDAPRVLHQPTPPTVGPSMHPSATGENPKINPGVAPANTSDSREDA